MGGSPEKDLPVRIRHRAVDVQECERSITTLLSVHVNKAEANTLVQVVVESDTLRKVGAGVESARALVVIDCRTSEGVFEDPVGASFGPVETLSCAVAGRVDAIFVIQVDHGHDTGDIDALEVSNTSSIVGWGLELRELPLGDLALADGVVIVSENHELALEGKMDSRMYLLVGTGEDVDV